MTPCCSRPLWLCWPSARETCSSRRQGSRRQQPGQPGSAQLHSSGLDLALAHVVMHGVVMAWHHCPWLAARHPLANARFRLPSLHPPLPQDFEEVRHQRGGWGVARQCMRKGLSCRAGWLLHRTGRSTFLARLPS